VPQRRALTPKMNSNLARFDPLGMIDRVRRTIAKVVRKPSTQQAIPGLPREVVVTHILGAINDPYHLARLREVSPAMHDAVAATGRELKEHDTKSTAELGYLSTLQHLLIQGRLDKTEVCTTAAKGGHFDVLKWLRENGCPWDLGTCMMVVNGDHLDVLKWLHENGCPWNETTTLAAQMKGKFDILAWARANGCPVNPDNEFVASVLNASGTFDQFDNLVGI